MIFRQLFEPISSTYTYLLGSEVTGEAILIDPVIVAQDRDLAEVARLGLKLAWTVDTHVHADHITGALELRQRTGCNMAAPAPEQVPCADMALEEGKPLQVGDIILQPLHTPGHTSGRTVIQTPCMTACTANCSRCLTTPSCIRRTTTRTAMCHRSRRKRRAIRGWGRANHSRNSGRSWPG